MCARIVPIGRCGRRPARLESIPTTAATQSGASAPPRRGREETPMCRWLAYSGTPLTLHELLYTGAYSLISQSLPSPFGAEPTNGDGFGVGWYDTDGSPGVFRSIEPAWNDANLREISPRIRSGLVMAHIRAAIGSPVQQTNCHPFRHHNWLFMHNGFLGGFHDVKRDLVLEIDPSLCPSIEGSADTEVLFYLALT